MSSIDRIKDTTMQGLGIGVFAGVSSGLMKNISKMFDTGVTRKKQSKNKKRKR